MNNDDVMIIKPIFPLRNPEYVNRTRKAILEQKAEGVIMLPFEFDVVFCSEDTAVKLGTDKDEDKIIHNAVSYICMADKNGRSNEADRLAKILYDRAYRKGFEAGKLEGHEKLVEKVVYEGNNNDNWDGIQMGML